MVRTKVPSSSDPLITKNELIATRRARKRRASADARCVRLRNTSAEPGGFTIGKIAASTSRKISTAALPAHVPGRASDGLSPFPRTLRHRLLVIRPAGRGR